MNPVSVIFLGIDGVLNGYSRRSELINFAFKWLKVLPKHTINELDIFTIKKRYVKRLSKIVKRTNAIVIMSSSWRMSYWGRSYSDMSKNEKTLHDLLKHYNVKLSGITPRSLTGVREDEIQSWLDTTSINVSNFVILDDEAHGLKRFLGTNLVKTSSVSESDIIRGLPYENTGLKNRHVKQAIRMLSN